jgi:hypothetical protein
MLRALVAPGNGMPFLNDSLFFLGNAYFSEVDKIIARRAPNFIRFADDYKIFGPSSASLESQFEIIQSDLKAIGFETNDKKIWLGSGEDYLDAVSKMKYGATQESDYADSAVQPGVYEPSSMLGSIKTCLAKPEDYLHQGFGRLQMGAIRRMRATAIYSDAKGYWASPDNQFGQLLLGDPATITTICHLLEEYSQNNDNTWRLLWILYLCKDLDAQSISDANLKARLISILNRIQTNQTLSVVCRIWAKAMPDYPGIQKSLAEIEELHTLDYADRGQSCYGT